MAEPSAAGVGRVGLASASRRPGFPGSRSTRARLRAPRLHPRENLAHVWALALSTNLLVPLTCRWGN